MLSSYINVVTYYFDVVIILKFIDVSLKLSSIKILKHDENTLYLSMWRQAIHNISYLSVNVIFYSNIQNSMMSSYLS